MPYMQALVDKVGFTCVAFEQLPNGEFVIVNKVKNRNDIKVTDRHRSAVPALSSGFRTYRARLGKRQATMNTVRCVAAPTDASITRGKLRVTGSLYQNRA